MAKRESRRSRQVVAVGASAGGVEALSRLLQDLPDTLPAAVLTVLHLGPLSNSGLDGVLRRVSKLPVAWAKAGERVAPGRVYLAPPDRHMLVEGGSILLAAGPRENRVRPAVDPLFRSVARGYGQLAVGVVLSGTLDDGSAGLVAIRRAGGLAVVQDPEEAAFGEMPRNALTTAGADHVVRLQDLGRTLSRAVQEALPAEVAMARGRSGGRGRVAGRSASSAPDLDLGEPDADAPPGSPSLYSCPDCGGVLFEQSGAGNGFRCRVGHRYSPESLLSQEQDKVEEALWAGLRALEESATLSSRLAERATQRAHQRTAAQFTEQALAATTRARTLRELLMTGVRRDATRPSKTARSPAPSGGERRGRAGARGRRR